MANNIAIKVVAAVTKIVSVYSAKLMPDLIVSRRDIDWIIQLVPYDIVAVNNLHLNGFD